MLFTNIHNMRNISRIKRTYKHPTYQKPCTEIVHECIFNEIISYNTDYQYIKAVLFLHKSRTKSSAPVLLCVFWQKVPKVRNRAKTVRTEQTEYQ